VPARDVRIPMLVVGGDDDKFIPLGVARRIAQRYGAPLHVAHGHGHFLLAEPGWEEHALAIIDWIDRLPASTRNAVSGRTGTTGANPVRL
jgi:pimeloyl-ACP methyl ester carboxylesterase